MDDIHFKEDLVYDRSSILYVADHDGLNITRGHYWYILPTLEMLHRY